MILFGDKEPIRNVDSSPIYNKLGADPGFSVGGGADPPGGRQHTILSKFPKNCMKSRKFWTVGGREPGEPSPLDPPL